MTDELEEYKTPLVVVIGEGPSDISYLDMPLRAYFSSKYGAKCKLISISDVTSDPHFKNDDLLKLLPGFIQGELSSPKNKINDEVAKNIKEIIQIIDIDEAFIDENLINENASKNDFFYTRSGIEYKSKELVKERNERKASRINKLLAINSVNVFGLDIPYSLFYFSINIDDFHYDNALNWSDDQKNQNASLFERKYFSKSDKGKIKLFCSLFKKNPPGYPDTFIDTWNYIMTNNNCLRTCSNLCIKIKE